MSFGTLSVGDLVFGIKSSLEGQYRQVAVEGEVSNISRTVAGHIYFTLSDERACVSVALFKADAMRNAAVRRMKEGDRVIVAGSVGVYAKRGVFQVVAKRISPAGKGNLALQFELLKEKLAKQGYFDASRKRPIPAFPKKIAVITAPYGAALQDFLKVMKRRSLWHHIVVVPAVVQGEGSAPSLVEALKQAQKLEGVEVIALTRGGGAMEDLWSFNHESVVKAIFDCSIPVISAVGHQVDTTLSDFAADLRLETPSAAAEYLSQPHTEIARRLEGLGQKLRGLLYERRHLIQTRLERVNPFNLARGLEMRVREMRHRLSRIELIEKQELYLGINDKHMLAGELVERSSLAMEKRLELVRSRVEACGALLAAMDPKNVLKRGYCYVEAEGERVIANFAGYDKLKTNEHLTIHFSDGNGKAVKE